MRVWTLTYLIACWDHIHGYVLHDRRNFQLQNTGFDYDTWYEGVFNPTQVAIHVAQNIVDWTGGPTLW